MFTQFDSDVWHWGDRVNDESINTHDTTAFHTVSQRWRQNVTPSCMSRLTSPRHGSLRKMRLSLRMRSLHKTTATRDNRSKHALRRFTREKNNDMLAWEEKQEQKSFFSSWRGCPIVSKISCVDMNALHGMHTHTHTQTRTEGGGRWKCRSGKYRSGKYGSR